MERDEPGSVSDLFWAVARRLRHTSRETLAPWDVTPSQLRALGTLMRHGAARPGALAKHLGIAPRSATEVGSSRSTGNTLAETRVVASS